MLFFIGLDKLKGIWKTGSFEMGIQQQKLSTLLVRNIGRVKLSQNKIKKPVAKFGSNIPTSINAIKKIARTEGFHSPLSWASCVFMFELLLILLQEKVLNHINQKAIYS
ncbi:MAG: hypothetical protein ACI8XX_002290 [Polaribacter sp.]